VKVYLISHLPIPAESARSIRRHIQTETLPSAASPHPSPLRPRPGPLALGSRTLVRWREKAESLLLEPYSSTMLTLFTLKHTEYWEELGPSNPKKLTIPTASPKRPSATTKGVKRRDIHIYLPRRDGLRVPQPPETITTERTSFESALPSHCKGIAFEKLIRDCWAKVEWGYGRILVRDGANAGWISTC
jgi:hypothetical protein